MLSTACRLFLVALVLAGTSAWADEPDKAPAPPARSAAFPLPSFDGKPLAATEGQKRFHVPMRMARVEKFYWDRFANDAQVTLAVGSESGRRTVTIVSKRKTDAWTRAVLHDSEVETIIDVTFVLRGADLQVQGKAGPAVELVITRSEEVRKMVESIDHFDQ